MHPSPEILNELVRRLVDAVHPTRIILFGSAARGEMTEHSDLDVLVIVPDGTEHVETWNKAYRSLRRFPYPKDIVVVTESVLAERSLHCSGCIVGKYCKLLV